MLKLLTITTLFVLLFSGCATKENELNIEYRDRIVKAPIYEFQIVDINGATIEIKSAYYQSPTMKVGINEYKNTIPQYEIRLHAKDVANICGSYMTMEKDFYRNIIDGFYVRQINEYNKLNGVKDGKN